jgi:MFS family permease
VIFGVYAIGVVVSLFVVGHISDWHGRRRVLVPALLLAIATAVVFLLWHGLGALLIARVASGLAVGAVTATATAWIGELHAADRPEASPRRAQIVATAVNLGGIGFGPLVAGVLAQWVGDPLTVPYLVFIGALALALALVASTPETADVPEVRPRYRPQRVSVPAESRGRYYAAGIGAFISFAAFGLFTSLAPTFLVDTMHDPSRALAGATAFAVFAAGAAAQTMVGARSTRETLAAGFGVLLAGFAIVVIAVWLAHPSLALFLIGGVLAGAGAGLVFRGVLDTVATLAAPERRAEALAGMFLAGYVGIAIPVLGLGVLTQYVAARVGLLVFAGALAAGIAIATPALLGGRRQLASPPCCRCSARSRR